MTSSVLGMTVLRTIPSSTLVGLVTGKYTLHGGVIRHAAGTPQGGQIVAHLISGSGLSQGLMFLGLGILPAAASAIVGIVPIVLNGITLVNTFKILKATEGLMTLAELNLAVTGAGFASLERRLNQLETKIDELKATVQEIEIFLQMEQRAELQVALEHLNRIDTIFNDDVRRELLVASAITLGKISLIYEQRLDKASTLTEAMISEEYFCIAMLAQARCYAELREPAMARQTLGSMYERWQRLARQVMMKYLIRQNPEKFLGSEFAADVPIARLANWLDFAYNKQKGLDWIDELRAKGDPWFYHKSLDGLPLSRRLSSESSIKDIKDIYQTKIIPALEKLVARNGMLNTYLARYELMEQRKLTASEFEREIASIGVQDQVEGFIILEPLAQAAA